MLTKKEEYQKNLDKITKSFSKSINSDNRIIVKCKTNCFELTFYAKETIMMDLEEYNNGSEIITKRFFLNQEDLKHFKRTANEIIGKENKNLHKFIILYTVFLGISYTILPQIFIVFIVLGSLFLWATTSSCLHTISNAKKVIKELP